MYCWHHDSHWRVMILPLSFSQLEASTDMYSVVDAVSRRRGTGRDIRHAGRTSYGDIRLESSVKEGCKPLYSKLPLPVMPVSPASRAPVFGSSENVC